MSFFNALDDRINAAIPSRAKPPAPKPKAAAPAMQPKVSERSKDPKIQKLIAQRMAAQKAAEAKGK